MKTLYQALQDTIFTYNPRDNKKKKIQELLEKIESISTTEEVKSIIEIDIKNAVEGGYTECLRFLLDLYKGFPLEDKVHLININVIYSAATKGKTECLKLLLNYPQNNKDFTFSTSDLQSMIYLARDLGRENNKECLLPILDFLLVTNEHEFIQDNGRDLWLHVQYNNLEAKAHRLWLSTQFTLLDIDEVNNRLLQNKELGFQFFSNVCFSMMQGGKEIDRNIIPENKKDILGDIQKFYRGEKHGYHYKFFQDIAALDEVIINDKVQATISIFTMESEAIELLVSLHKHSDKLLYRTLGEGYIKYCDSLVKILSLISDLDILLVDFEQELPRVNCNAEYTNSKLSIEETSQQHNQDVELTGNEAEEATG